ncbi:acetate/propionate family kinase [Aporhodopirellula aestuarii]|uniref:Acetate kinase n=1 Tax=Aporhodopirellula aestuarii TaxID=2950107 RepID=A0ABT0UDM8_9BACT|nr:acetate/propionate family kinase [Aporhodopirellula aestuarii]MCM2374840.1 acetate/propionate family kinase [Aporhodopirellula aestuarii]
MNILVFNVGSTTLKYACVEVSTGERLYEGLVDRIGQVGGDAPDHLSAARCVLEQAGLLPSTGKTAPSDAPKLSAIAHRIVQGGDSYPTPTIVNADVLEHLKALDSLAPLHNPSARSVVAAIDSLGVPLPQVLVFDTAYFSTLQPSAYRYAIPESIYNAHGIRKYGFHGTSHRFVTRLAIERLGLKSPARVISLHLGGGASATASIDGVAVDTSMGMTPLEGLVMATRCGDMDPSVPLHLIRSAGMSADDVDRLLNKESGLVGLCGEADMRAILSRREAGDSAAHLAIEIYVRRIQKTIGSYLAILGGLDALIFTAGVGEHAVKIRELVTTPLSHLGITIDPSVNESPELIDSVADISHRSATVRTLIVATNEELAIARESAQLIAQE